MDDIQIEPSEANYILSAFGKSETAEINKYNHVHLIIGNYITYMFTYDDFFLNTN